VKTVIYLIVIIGWGILQARRKAMREQARKQTAGQAASPTPPRASQRQPTILGPVSAEENRPIYADRSIPLPTPTVNVTRDRSIPIVEEPPEEIRPLMESAKRKKKKKADAEVVEEIVQPVATDAYDQAASVRRHIAFDKDALRTFMVTREILGPPRAKKPHRPGMRSI
jgi:hypothetical protein